MKNNSLTYILAFAVSFSIFSCKSGGEFTGREYMPDMAHSIAYEANQSTYYSLNQWSTKAEYEKYVQPRLPVPGTVPHGKSEEEFHNRKSYTYPTYAFGNTEEERTRATELILDNPIKVSSAKDLENVLGKGKELYEIYCSSCHGKAADGNGQLYASGAYPAAPQNFMKDELIASNDGRYYHAIMHGKNVMLSHADKLSHDERWMVIHYIRSLQAAKKGTEYNVETANSRNGGKLDKTDASDKNKDDKETKDKKSNEKKK
jgi:mono/diheme cytochrome c family protein